MTETRITIKELEGILDIILKDLTLGVTANLIEATPVDTGWARSNWIPNIASAYESTAGTRVQAELGNINKNVQQQGLANVVANYTTTLGPIYITNNVPYITRLNEGSSKQAPSGFVQGEISRAIRSVGRRGNNQRS